MTVNGDAKGHSDDDAGSRSTSSTNLASMFGRKGRSSPKHKGNAIPPSNPAQEEQRPKKAERPETKHMAVSGRTSLEQQARKMGRTSKREPILRKNEVDEFNNPYREDLRSWKIRDINVT